MAQSISDTLKLGKGQWLAVNCGGVPQSDCHLVLMAPDNEKSDLVEAAVAHAVKRHGHKDTRELREQLTKSLGHVTI
jgi:hypothetical protein